MDTAEAQQPPSTELHTRIRLANQSDVSHIHKLIRQMSISQHQTHLFSATLDTLSSTLFTSLPFQSPTVLLLEVSSESLISSPHNPQFSPILKILTLPAPISDPEESDFMSSENDGVVVAGFVLFFPNYSSYSAKWGFYVEDLFVRECYRRNGMGRMMMAAVARKAAEMGMGRVEWTVLQWNVDAVRFYETMGAEVLEGDRICRLDGEALRSYGCGPSGGRSLRH